MPQNKITYAQPTAKPTRKVTAAGVSGIVLGVPIASPLANVLMGVLKVWAPGMHTALADIHNFESSLASLIAVLIAVGTAYAVKERA